MSKQPFLRSYCFSSLQSTLLSSSHLTLRVILRRRYYFHLQMSKLRLGERQCLIQGHTSSNWGGLNSDPDSKDPALLNCPEILPLKCCLLLSFQKNMEIRVLSLEGPTSFPTPSHPPHHLYLRCTAPLISS